MRIGVPFNGSLLACCEKFHSPGGLNSLNHRASEHLVKVKDTNDDGSFPYTLETVEGSGRERQKMRSPGPSNLAANSAKRKPR
jgi:hypothetical protein